MSNYFEYNDTIAFHPGYYIKEIIDEGGLTQEDFAKRMDTSAKNLSLLIRGEQSLSVDIAMKLSRMMGTSVAYWLNLQSAYDTLVAEAEYSKELDDERKVFKYFDYKYFVENFGLPVIPRKIDEQIQALRKYLNVSSLSVLTKRNMAVSFRSASSQLSEASIVKANAMVQLATNYAMRQEAPKYDKKRFEEAVKYALTLTTRHNDFYPMIKKAFHEAGVILVILPNISGSKINGATKKIGDNIMLMVNDRRLSADSFWFTLFHEIGHIVNGDYGISFEAEEGKNEAEADKYAEDSLIPPDEYMVFVKKHVFDKASIIRFAKEINRDAGIVLGRLQNDGFVGYKDKDIQSLRHKYRVKIVF